MRKKHNWCKRILMSVWLAAFLSQLVLAVCWAVQNWNCVQEFYDTKIYIDGIINRTTDGWHLPGYSVLLFVIRKFFGFVKAEYIPGVYMFQVLFSLFCFIFMDPLLHQLGASGNTIGYAKASFVLFICRFGRDLYSYVADNLADAVCPVTGCDVSCGYMHSGRKTA